MITLINVPGLSGLGVRSISALLKKHDIETRLIFLCNYGRKVYHNWGNTLLYDDAFMDQIAQLCKDSSLVGLSFLSTDYNRALQLTKRLRESLNVPIIWGNVHATALPEDSLQYADMVCIGEGELAMLELAQKMQAGQDFYNVKNIWFKKNGNIIKNDVRPLIQDLDSLPHSDYDLTNHFAYDRDKNDFLHLTQDNFKELLIQNQLPSMPGYLIYDISTSRGCAHNCSYCCNSKYRKLYQKQRYLRFRSPEKVIEELTQSIRQFNYINCIQFSDDVFSGRKTEDLNRLTAMYKKEIGHPFIALASPLTLNDQKLDAMVNAGLYRLHIGVQTGSAKTAKIFSRQESTQTIKKMAKEVHKFAEKIPELIYDFILDAPWETNKDRFATLELIMSFPRPYILALSSLQFFPCSSLFTKAKEFGLSNSKLEENWQGEFMGIQPNYANTLIKLYYRFHIPKPIMRILMNERIANFLDYSLFKSFYSFLFKLKRKITVLFRQPKKVKT